MKKLLVLMLVLGMASFANADLILTINGSPAPDAITLTTSETIELDVDLVQGETILGYDLSVVVSNAQGALSSLDINLHPENGFLIVPKMVKDLPQEYRFTGGDYPGMPGKDGPLILLSGLMFHCEEATPVEITLVSRGVLLKETGQPAFEEYGDGYVFDRIAVTQIPEPATMLLLGLGGLFLRRRK
jgi:hypothetical protein